MLTARAERIERIRVLLEEQRHPERRVGVFSATNLTRLALRFGAMGLVTGLVHAAVGGTLAEVPLAAVAVGGADHLTTRLWRRVGRSVQHAWTVTGLTLGTLSVLIIVAGPHGPLASITGSANGWVTRLQVTLDERAAARQVPIAASAAAGPGWLLITRNGSARLGTFTEAQAWCADLGTGWHLPPGLGAWPELAAYPNIGTLLYVWTAGGTGVQIGDGRRPAVGVSGSGRTTQVEAVICLEGRP